MSNLSDRLDEHWAEIEPLFVGMREYKHSKRELTNAVSTRKKQKEACSYPSIKRFCADKGYRGTFIYDAYDLLPLIYSTLHKYQNFK